MAANGSLNLSTLEMVDGWAYLNRNAAAAWEAGCDEIEALGYPRPSITAPDGAYRPYQQQVAMKAYWTAQGKPENAATAGTSGHGWATDVDIFKNWLWPHALLVKVFGKYGFTFNVSWELWHMHHNDTATASLDATRIPEEKVEHDMSIAIFRSIRGGVGEFLVYASPSQVACSRELSTISTADRAFEFRVAQNVALGAGLGADYKIPTVDDGPNGGWYIRNQIAGRIAAMPADFPLSPTNPFIPLVYYARGGGEWVGPSAAEIKAALASDFAAVNANIDDQPTSFEITPK